MIATVRALVAVSELASATCTVKLLVPVPVGVPEITPVPGARVSPAGSDPETMDHVYGVVPPAAASVALYAMFCVPAANEVVVIEGGVDATTVRVSGCVAVCDLASVICTVKLVVPAPVGVPEITPVLGASVSPAGSAPETMDHAYGVVPLVAASVAL